MLWFISQGKKYGVVEGGVYISCGVSNRRAQHESIIRHRIGIDRSSYERSIANINVQISDMSENDAGCQDWGRVR